MFAIKTEFLITNTSKTSVIVMPHLINFFLKISTPAVGHFLRKI